ncbi:MAG: apolipoprotein N-acyltransferase [Legionellaceae bacterium]|nr:apolipoprotein N-acyltransferase [Legionellaceae bacterium]
MMFKSLTLSSPRFSTISLSSRWIGLFAGLLLPLAFAPFHLPGIGFLSIALLYNATLKISLSNPPKRLRALFSLGFHYGIGFFSFGVSWVFISIHEYGHLHPLLSALITGVFIAYLSLFPAGLAVCAGYKPWISTQKPLQSAAVFSALWVLFEALRSFLCTGFPWLLLGYSQMDSPLQSLLPCIGVFGTGFYTCFTGVCLAQYARAAKPAAWLGLFFALIFAPYGLHNIHWTHPDQKPLSVAIIQPNMAMRDKWDSAYFWELMHRYEKNIQQTLPKDLIIFPESAIPLPGNYITSTLDAWEQQSQQQHSSLLLGIPESIDSEDYAFYNTMKIIGDADGSYYKQQLVPFGEYIPHWISVFTDYIGIPNPQLRAGPKQQPLLRVANQPLASLICYELAYDHLLRAQLPEASWIISISDDGWFGHSLAMYQQAQMAQVRALQTGRYHVVSNNDGLSAIINAQGQTVQQLAAFTDGILTGNIQPMQGSTPWVQWGNLPIWILCSMILLFWNPWRRG